MTGTEQVEFDAIVVGMGVGGEQVAGGLAEAGWSVLGIEARLVGGECPYWGCIPSKMAVRAAQLLAEGRRIDGMAGTATVQPDWGPVAARIREATDDWDDTVAVERFTDKGGTFVRGEARLVDAKTVQVGDERYLARRALVVASGTQPVMPPIDGLAKVPHWTNRDALAAPELPGSMILLGGGAIGCELAQLFGRFGVEVTLVEAEDQLLSGETPAAGALLAGVLERDGVAVVTARRAERVTGDDESVEVSLSDGGTLVAERLLVAIGRAAPLAALGAEALGVDPGARFLPVDENLQVTDGVWAVGDVTGKGGFTHMAMYQSRLATADILGRPHEAADYRAVPRVTFTDPEIGAVGLTPAQARDAGIEVVLGTVAMPTTARGWIHGVGNDGFIELVSDGAAGVLVGATAAGPAGGEVLGLLTLAIHAQVPITRLRQMIYAYPTFHRGVEDALRELTPTASP
jgi:pyruvate/2-oxoglutarate dehydrogenase complex dihydrolipoamide dehydrogenase (E3) component